MIIIAFDPGVRLGWSTNSTAHHRGQRGVFDLDDWVSEWYGSEVSTYSEGDLLARRLASARRIADSTLAHPISPDCFVVERQLNMGSAPRARSHEVNRDVEKVLIEVAGFRDILLLRPAPSTWQAWAKRNQEIAFLAWQTSGKPDDLSAHMMLQWALATQKMEAA